MRGTGIAAAASIAALAAAGCGDEEKFAGSPDPATERNDRPAEPPPGWRTLANRRAGFTVSIPREWTASTRGSATLIRSSDRLVAVTVAADRSDPGRKTPPAAYARRTFRALPGFRRLRAGGARRIAASPYPSARVNGTGTLAGRRQRQRITVAAFRRARRATYTIVAFSAVPGGGTSQVPSLDPLLASLRARRPAL